MESSGNRSRSQPTRGAAAQTTGLALLTRDTKASVSAKDGLVTLSGNLSTEILLAAAEVVSGVEGVRDYEYRVRGGEAG